VWVDGFASVFPNCVVLFGVGIKVAIHAYMIQKGMNETLSVFLILDFARHFELGTLPLAEPLVNGAMCATNLVERVVGVRVEIIHVDVAFPIRLEGRTFVDIFCKSTLGSLV
jgi:hypothetical protein